MSVKFSNNATTELASSIGTSDTSITVVDASKFPILTAGDYTYVTLDTDTASPTREIVRVTAISGNVLTITRGQDGTSPASFAAGTKVELRLTAALLNDVAGANPSGEPIGFPDKSQTTITFDSGTRTFSITPTGASFDVYCKGIKYTYTTVQLVTIPNTTGLHFIYFSASGVLSTQMSYFTWEEHAPTAYVYWNATTQQAIYFADERHGITLDWQTHEYLHRTRGAAIANGFAASGYTTTGLGATDADAQIDIGGGTFFDEDMQVDIVSTNTPVAGTWQQDLSGPARIPVLYLSGSAWVIDAPTNFPFKVVSSVPQYNLYSGGTWSTASVTNNSYFVSWILATNNLTYPVVSIISQAPTNQVSVAEAMTFEGLNLNGFPSVEFRPLYKVIYQYKDGFANSVKSSTIAVYDLRSISSAGVAAALVQDHGNLSGLTDDDHPQYVHTSEVRTPSAAVKNSFFPSQVGQTGKYLSTDGTNTVWEPAPSGSLSFTGDVTGTGSTGSSVSLTLAASGVVAGQYTKVTVDAKGRVTAGTSVTSSDVTTALGYTPYNATNPAGYTTNVGTVTSVSGTGTVSGLTLTGSVTSSGSLTLGGTLSLTSGQVTTALGFTPYNATNPSGYITGITSGMVTTALGYTPYNSSNPSSYITSSASITGNAATATSLQTARNINGTSFNGSANITTASWGTARTITIGSTGKSVDGSGNVSWTLGEIGAVGSGNTMTVNAEYSGTIAQNQTGWYTIASYGSGRAEATFHLSDQDSSRHNYVRANIVWSFGYGGIVVDTSGRHGVSTIRNIRLLYNTSDRTYGGVKVQVYCEGTGDQAWTLRVRQETTTTSGWGNFTEITPVLEGTPAGWAEGYQAYYVNEQGQISTSSSSAYFAGNLALHSGNYNSYALPLSGGTLTGGLGVGAIIGSRGTALSVSGSSNSSAIVAKSSDYATVSSILPHSSSWTYYGTGVYYNNGAWVHASADSNNALFGINGSVGGSWWASSTGTASWNVASGTALWNAAGTWVGSLNAAAGAQVNSSAILTSANYSSYALPLSGGTITGNLQLGSQTNRYLSWYTNTNWFYYLAGEGNNLRLYDSDGTSFLQTSYGSGGATKWVELLGSALRVNNNGLVTSGGKAIADAWVQSDRDFPNGTLITTDINYNVTSGDPFVLEIRGNSYGNIVPLDIQYQGYIYSDTIINHGGISNGLYISGLVAINNGGNLCFWFPSQGYWNGYYVRVYVPYATYPRNRVTSITHVAKPTTAKQVDLSANIRQSLHSSNYTSYAVALSGDQSIAGTKTFTTQIRTNRIEGTDGAFLLRGGANSGTTRHLNLSDSETDPASSGSVVGITWGARTDSNPYYLIYPRYYSNGYSTHNRLVLAWHTGIEIGAASGYGGTRFFNNSPFAGSEIFSVGKGDDNVRVANSLYVQGDSRGQDVYTTGGWFRNHTNNNGIYWSQTGWHLYPADAGNFYVRSGTSAGSLLFLNSGGSGLGYVHAAADAAMGFLNTSGNWRLRVDNSGNTTCYNNLYLNQNYGHGHVGLYDSYRYQGVFFMGDAYKMSADGTSLANMYGIGWSHPNAGGAAGNLTDHGMLIINNGSFRCAISNSIVASGNITAYSDERLKKNWRDMPDNFVERLAQVRNGCYERIDDGMEQVGVSAQSLQKLLPEAILTAKDEIGTLSVSYGNAAMASAVELAKELVMLKKELAEIKSRLH